jgi:hypothetical protein
MSQDFRFDQLACIDYTSNHILKLVVLLYDLSILFQFPLQRRPSCSAAGTIPEGRLWRLYLNGDAHSYKTQSR